MSNLFRLFALLVFALIAKTAQATVITDIRMGNFNGVTRLVIEHQGPVVHRMQNSTVRDGTFHLELSNATSRVSRINGPLADVGVTGSQVQSTTNPNRVQISLRFDGQRGTEILTLENPNRLVIDFPVERPAPVIAPQQGITAGPWVRRIIVDPGHGGSDPGAVGRIGNRTIKESDIALAVSLRLERLLQSDPRFDVRLTRRDDTRLTLTERTRAASRMRGDLFVSIHANAVEGAANQRRARGFEIWTWNREANRSAAARAVEQLENRDPGVNRQNNQILTSMMIDALESQALVSRRVAQAVHSRAIQHSYLRRHDRGIDSARFKVLEVYDMPSILVELGFMTHPEEVRMLASPEFQQEWAVILYEGIIRYYELNDPSFPRRAPTVAARR